ncbi:hypothetical protein DSO57_1017348 [Entomophthora muscae]|uniref:Uncharacterized protein n=1 Tax=Entomophthora muscae TaxID=34485 RepID=A0ACC2SHJ2_9FUNG|nr:hypothetical protein DSO57_1017348 [Entomophthora muscae]
MPIDNAKQHAGAWFHLRREAHLPYFTPFYLQVVNKLLELKNTLPQIHAQKDPLPHLFIPSNLDFPK